MRITWCFESARVFPRARGRKSLDTVRITWCFEDDGNSDPRRPRKWWKTMRITWYFESARVFLRERGRDSLNAIRIIINFFIFVLTGYFPLKKTKAQSFAIRKRFLWRSYFCQFLWERLSARAERSPPAGIWYARRTKRSSEAIKWSKISPWMSYFICMLFHEMAIW